MTNTPLHDVPGFMPEQTLFVGVDLLNLTYRHLKLPFLGAPSESRGSHSHLAPVSIFLKSAEDVCGRSGGRGGPFPCVHEGCPRDAGHVLQV